MTTIYDYLKYYKDYSFRDYPFNEIDNIIFAELSYLNWENIVSSNKTKISLEKAATLYLDTPEKNTSNSFLKGIIENLETIYTSLRYKDCMLSYFRNNLNQTQQFGSLCIHFLPRNIYVSYRGTDRSIVGWKEDFIMAYHFPIASQQNAINYLNEVISWTDKIIYVGGHSKGGNLAMTSAMYCKKKIERRIKTVFNNDGPGFRIEQFNSPAYKQMLTKLKMFTPEESVVGMLLLTSPTFQVIKSNAKGINQHNCNTWQCFGTFFERGNLSSSSQRLDNRITQWLQKYDDRELEKIVITFFSILEKNNITTLDDFHYLKINRVLTIINNIKDLDQTTKNLYITAFRNLISKVK